MTLPDLTAFANTRPPWALSGAPPTIPALAERALTTWVSFRRAALLQEAVLLTAEAFPAWRADLDEAARRVGQRPPPALLAGGGTTAIVGTDADPLLVLSGVFATLATAPERRFAWGRLLGHLRLRQVTAFTLHQLAVDDGALGDLLRLGLTPLLAAPLGVGARATLGSWARTAEIAADRAGLIAAGDLAAARRGLLRSALQVVPEVDAPIAGAPTNPVAAALQARPGLATRDAALAAFARSRAFALANGETPAEDALDDEALAAATAAALRGIS